MEARPYSLHVDTDPDDGLIQLSVIDDFGQSSFVCITPEHARETARALWEAAQEAHRDPEHYPGRPGVN